MVVWIDDAFSLGLRELVFELTVLIDNLFELS